MEDTKEGTAESSGSNLARLHARLIARISWMSRSCHRDDVIGKMMTLLEASIADKQQCEAAKSIAKTILHRSVDDLCAVVQGLIASLAKHQKDEAYFEEGWPRPKDEESPGYWS